MQPASGLPASGRVPGAHGLTLHLLRWSDEGVPLLLVHGFGNDAHVWDDFAPRVAPYYRTLALDLAGHGDSDRDPEGRYAYEDHVAHLEAATAALGVARLVLVGHSLGGRVSMLFAGRHPERMAGLVIVDAGPELDPRGTGRIRMDARRGADASFASVAEYERALAHAYPAAQPEALRRMARHGLRRRDDGRLERKTDPAYHRGLAGLSEAERETQERETTARLWEALGRIPCPTLVVRGAASDVLSADCADRMEETLPKGSLAVVPRASHSVMIDNPAGFADAVCGFVLG
ncbi:MAG: alpha/beta hydrolase [Myxococcota bacterium]|nr:alpha/beta hydrolase [Myxococcota bacterium]